MLQPHRSSLKRKGQAMVEYALLLAGIAVASVVGIAVLGHKTADQYSLLGVIMPGAHAEDNNAIQSSEALIPFTTSNGVIVLDTSKLIGGQDRMAGVLGAGGGEVLLPSPP